MAQIKSGDKLRDNDPRMPNRVLTVIGVFPKKVAALSPVGREVTISLSRIYTDGKARRTGFSLESTQ